MLPWREIGAKVVVVAETAEGLVDTVHLTQQLKVSLLVN